MEKFKYGHLNEDIRKELIKDISTSVNRLSLENLLDQPDHVIGELLVREFEKMIVLKKVYDMNRKVEMKDGI